MKKRKRRAPPMFVQSNTLGSHMTCIYSRFTDIDEKLARLVDTPRIDANKLEQLITELNQLNSVELKRIDQLINVINKLVMNGSFADGGQP